MERRNAIKHLGFLVGSTLIFSACELPQKKVLESYNNLNITIKDKNLLASICDAIIPAGGGMKGAKELEVENFVLVMVNDCYGKEYQKEFRTGLLNFEEYVIYNHGVDFLKSTQNEKESVLRKISKFSNPDNLKKNINHYENNSIVMKLINNTKSLLIHGYTTSEYFMTEIMPYKIAPGPFKGEVEVNENEQINIYD